MCAGEARRCLCSFSKREFRVLTLEWHAAHQCTVVKFCLFRGYFKTIRVNSSDKERIDQENTNPEQDPTRKEMDVERIKGVPNQKKSERHKNPNSISSVNKTKGKYFKERLNASRR